MWNDAAVRKVIDEMFQARRIPAEDGLDDRKRHDLENWKLSSMVHEESHPHDEQIAGCLVSKAAGVEAAKKNVMGAEKSDEREAAMQIRRLPHCRDGEMIDPCHRPTPPGNPLIRQLPCGAAEWNLVRPAHPIQHCHHYDHH